MCLRLRRAGHLVPAVVFLVALGTDYNIFLMTRLREEALKYGTRRGALIGLGATGGVITSAGMVLAGTFAVLGTLPLVFLAELGFAVAFAVLLDAIIVRSVPVTAMNLDIGPADVAAEPAETQVRSGDGPTRGGRRVRPGRRLTFSPPLTDSSDRAHRTRAASDRTNR